MKTSDLKATQKSNAQHTKAIQKFVWTLATAIAEQINTTIVSAARANKLTMSEKDVALLTAIVSSTAESTVSGATKTLLASLQK